MNQRMWCLSIAFAVSLGACARNPSAVNRPALAQDVVLITVDGFAPSSFSALGGTVDTPHLAEIVAESTVYPEYWTASPVTRPAVATLLTGIAPDRHGVRDDLFTPLPEDLPTLAHRLGERGYRTAAFPDSSHLGRSSGLLDGFAVVDDPPAVRIDPTRWLPMIQPPEETARNVEAWLAGLEAGDRSFIWVHLSTPFVGQFSGYDPRRGQRLERLRGKSDDDSVAERLSNVTQLAESEAAKARGEMVGGFDLALGKILAALRARGHLDRTLLVVAGTTGTLFGEGADMPGPGFSLDERAIRVPLIVRFPAGVEPASARSAPRWGPDVARTIAEVTGVELDERAEGVALHRDPPADRAVFAWAYPLLDQMAWRVERAVRVGPAKRIAGGEEVVVGLDGAAEVDDETGRRLTEALAGRATMAPPALAEASVRELLEANGIVADAIDPAGRDVDPAERRRLARLLWDARIGYGGGATAIARGSLRRILEADPDSRAALLDLGQFRALEREPDARDSLRHALSRYPSDPELWHWYAHTFLPESWEEAERILTRILPAMPRDSDVLYDLACARSLGGDVEGSADYLARSLRAGFGNLDLVEVDPDLRRLRETPRFSEVLREFGR